MQKKQIIILIVIIVLIFGGVIAWSLIQKEKLSPEESAVQKKEETKETGQEPKKEIFSLSGKVAEINPKDNFLIVKPTKQDKEIKVLLSATTKLIKLEFPFDPKNPPSDGVFTPKQTEIEISDFQVGDNVFIKSKENIAEKEIIEKVDFIHILP